MGLVYDLNTTALPFQSNTFNWHEGSKSFDGSTEFANTLNDAFLGISFMDLGTGLPLDDWIIRGATYVNDYYIWYGSYKAYFENLYAAGSGGLAWDGFICVARAYNAITGGEFDPFLNPPPPGSDFVFPTGPFDIPFRSVYMIPMRLPFQLPPGVVGDAAKIADDNEPGVYGVNIATGLGVSGRSKQASKQASKHTHVHAQCCHASVGLTQARLNYITYLTSKFTVFL